MHLVLLALAATALSLPSAPADAQGICEVSSPSGNLGVAKERFATSCPGIVRRDCDPTPAGGWLCSSAAIENGVSLRATASVQSVALAPSASDPAPVIAMTGSAERAAEVCETISASAGLDDAKRSFAAACPGIVRRDCDPVSGGGWLCSSANIVNGVSVVPVASVSAFTPAPEPEPTAPEPAPAAVPAPSPEPVAAAEPAATPEPVAAPEPEPAPAPVAAAEPVAASEPEPAPAPVASAAPVATPEPAAAPEPVPAATNPFAVVDGERRDPGAAEDEEVSVAEGEVRGDAEAPSEPLAAARAPAEIAPTHDENGIPYCDP